MRALWIFSIALIAQSATALETITLKAGYNFRREPRVAADTRVRTIRRATPATLLASKGSWRKVCLNGRGPECTGGQVGWVIKSSFAATTAEPTGGREAKTQCYGGECARASQKKNALDAVEPIATALADNPTGFTLPRGFDRRCSTFIGPKGWGEWGRHLDRAANKVAHRCFYDRNMFGSLCPNYKALSTKDKNAVIALVGASIATVESNCNPHVRAQGTNDLAVGMFQMENSASVRARAGRDEQWCRTKQNINAYSPEFQTECSVSIIDDRICTLGAYIFDASGYWQKLRHNREITRLIRSTAVGWGLCE